MVNGWGPVPSSGQCHLMTLSRLPLFWDSCNLPVVQIGKVNGITEDSLNSASRLEPLTVLIGWYPCCTNYGIFSYYPYVFMISIGICPAKSPFPSFRPILHLTLLFRYCIDTSESKCSRWNIRPPQSDRLTLMAPMNYISRHSYSCVVPCHNDSGLGHQTCCGQWDNIKHNGIRGLRSACPLGMLAPGGM